MARLVLTDASVVVNGVNLSEFITSISLSTSEDVVDTTGMAAGGARTRVSGLADNSVTFEFNNDYATGGPEITMNAVGSSLVGTNTTVVVKPTSAAVSASNPSYTFSCVVAEWQSLSGAVGELATVSTTWPISGVVTKAVA
jgi:hypothetical protein